MIEATRVQDNVGFLLLQSNIEKAISVLATKYQQCYAGWGAAYKFT